MDVLKTISRSAHMLTLEQIPSHDLGEEIIGNILGLKFLHITCPCPIDVLERFMLKSKLYSLWFYGDALEDVDAVLELILKLRRSLSMIVMTDATVTGAGILNFMRNYCYTDRHCLICVKKIRLIAMQKHDIRSQNQIELGGIIEDPKLHTVFKVNGFNICLHWREIES